MSVMSGRPVFADFVYLKISLGSPENFATKNSETRAGGMDSKAVWTFCKNSSILANTGVP